MGVRARDASGSVGVVLVKEASEPVASNDAVLGKVAGDVALIRRIVAQSEVRAVPVAVVDVLAHDVVKVLPSEDQHVIEALVAHTSHESLSVRVGARGVEWSLHHLIVFAQELGVEGGAELGVAIVDEVVHPAGNIVGEHVLACWATHWPLGLVVAPAKWTRRDPISIKKRT